MKTDEVKNVDGPGKSARAEAVQAARVAVTFKQHWRGFAAGETAGFRPEIAEQLIKENIAVKAEKPDGTKREAPNGPTNRQTTVPGRPDNK